MIINYFRYLLLISLIFSVQQEGQAQNINQKVIDFVRTNKEYMATNIQIEDWIIKREAKKNSELKDYKDIRIFHIFDMGHPGFFFIDKDYIDYSFLKHLNSGCHFLKSRKLFSTKKWLVGVKSLITDSLGNYIANYYQGCLSIASHYTDLYNFANRELAKMFFNNEIDFVFTNGNLHWSGKYFCIKDNKLFVLEHKKLSDTKMSYYSWNEFLESIGVKVPQ